MRLFRWIVLCVWLGLSPMLSAATLLVLGDSLSAAYGIEPSKGWVSLLTQRLQTQHPDIQVVNASISGETTQGGITRLPALLERHQPHWIVLELAANDGLRGMPLKVIERNLTTLIEQSIAAGATPVLVGVHLPPNYGPAYTQRFFTLFETLAERHQIARVPFLMDGVALRPELMQSDGLHPNADAQPLMLENVWRTLHPILLAQP